jgi:uncharacterized protein (TIGR03437 family)
MRTRFIELLAGIVMMSAATFGQTITTVVGDDTNGGCSHDDGVPAVTECVMPSGIAFDKQGNLYLVDGVKVRKVDQSGIITTVAGTTYGYSGDGGPATSAKLTLQGGSPALSGLAVDSQGNIYISDTHNCAIRLVTAATGIITTMAGGTCGNTGDNGPATKASLNYPSGIALDGAGNLYIADNLSNRVRKVDKSSGMISTVAGDGDPLWESDGVAATTTGLRGPVGVRLDSHGNLYIAEGNRVRKVNTSGIISTIAGSTVNFTNFGSSGDGGLATAALLFGPLDMVVDPAGDIYIADNQNLKVRKIDTGGIISTYAGVFGPVSTPLGDGGPATSAYIGNPLGLFLDAAGNLYISETAGQVRKVSVPAPAAPAVTSGGVVTASSFGQFTSVAPGSWIEIYGSNLASDTRSWGDSDFSGVNAPTSLDGTSVTIGGQDAFVYFISPGQVDVQVPSNVPAGSQPVVVTTAGGAGRSVDVTVNALEPGLLSPANFKIGGVQYATALFPDGGFVLPEGAIAGVTSRPAKAGDTIILYGVGFGPVTPTIPAGQIVQGQNKLVSSFQITIGGMSATVNYEGLTPNNIGLYQFNVVVPAAASGAAPLTFTLNGTSGTQTLNIAVGN